MSGTDFFEQILKYTRNPMYQLEQRKSELQRELQQVQREIEEQEALEKANKQQWVKVNVDALLNLSSHARDDCVDSAQTHEIKNPLHCGRCALLYVKTNGYMYREFSIDLTFTFERY